MSATLDFARGLFRRGTECFGPDEILEVFGSKLAPSHDKVPPISFTEEELKRARELGQFLILCGPVTMAQTYDTLGNKLGGGKLLYDNEWYRENDFYLKGTTQSWRWCLTTREIIPGSTNQNYLRQTRTLAKYLTEQVYVGQTLPKSYADAVAELDRREEELAELMDEDWKKAAKELVGLQVNQLFRETPAQVLWSIALFKEVNHEYLLPNMYTWTTARSAGGSLVGVGRADPCGVRVGGDDPGVSRVGLGTLFSRSALVE